MAKIAPSSNDTSNSNNAQKSIIPITRKEMQARAKALAEQERFGNSKTSVFGTSLTQLGQLGIGIQLYFMLMKYLGILFTLMTILAMPALLIHKSGNGISDSIADPIGMAYFSLGNGGLHEDNNNTDSCLPNGHIDCTLKTLDNPVTPDPIRASYIISACDALYSLIFFLFIKFFKKRIEQVIESNDASNITPNDYAVMVTGLPKNATEKEVMEHFNKLYDLSKPRHKYPMWCGCFGRRKIPKKQPDLKANPVSNLDHVNGNDIYKGSYVAMVSIAYRTNGLLRKFLGMEKLAAHIAKRKAVCEMYAQYNNPKDFKRRANADLKHRRLQAKWDRKTAKVTRLKKGKPSIFQDCECAYVVFNHVASKDRCLRDYRTSGGKWARWFQPPSLRFRSRYALKVEEAPEPSNIIWENLEVSSRQRFWRRLITASVTCLLLLLSGMLIYTAQISQRTFKEKMPSNDLCTHTIPAIFSGSYDVIPSNPILKWNRGKDSSCARSGYYNIEFANVISNQVQVPSWDEKRYARCNNPCTSNDDSRICASLACINPEWEDRGYGCETYKAADMLYCMCKPILASAIKNAGPFKGLQSIWENNEPCRVYLWDYGLKNLMIFGAASTVVIVNLALKGILRKLAKFERHHSESSMASAMTFKLFFATFLNTAIIVLLINAKMPAVGFLSNFQGIFSGEYRDFEREWYTVVGVGISTTMIINSLAPQFLPLLQTYFIFPIKRWFKSRIVVTQEQMNLLYEGRPFDISVRFPLLLNTVFVTLFYCGGVPLLLPIAAISCFANYYLDKLFIIRLYTVRTAYDEALGKLAAGLLPWALFFHFCFSTWMYGNSELLQSRLLNIQFVMSKAGIESVGGDNIDTSVIYEKFLEHAQDFDPVGGRYGMIPKIVRMNAFPFFLVAVLMMVYWVLSKIGGKIILPILDKTIGRIIRLITGAAMRIKLAAFSEKIPTYEGVPEFTGPFEKIVSKKHRISEAEKLAGWRLKDGNKLIRVWTKDVVKNGVHRSANEQRLTWEAFRSPVPTYDMKLNSKYKNAAIKIEELKAKLVNQSSK